MASLTDMFETSKERIIQISKILPEEYKKMEWVLPYSLYEDITLIKPDNITRKENCRPISFLSIGANILNISALQI